MTGLASTIGSGDQDAGSGRADEVMEDATSVGLSLTLGCAPASGTNVSVRTDEPSSEAAEAAASNGNCNEDEGSGAAVPGEAMTSSVFGPDSNYAPSLELPCSKKNAKPPGRSRPKNSIPQQTKKRGETRRERQSKNRHVQVTSIRNGASSSLASAATASSSNGNQDTCLMDTNLMVGLASTGNDKSLPWTMSSHSQAVDNPAANVPARETLRFYADFKRVKLEGPEEPLENEEDLKEWVWQNHKDSILSSLSIKYEDEHSELEKSMKRLDLLDKIAQVQRQFLQSEGPKVVFGCLLESILQMMKSEYGFIGEVKYEEDGTMYLQTHAITNIAWDTATNAFCEANMTKGLKFCNLNTLFGKVMTSKEPVLSNTPKNDKRAGGIPKGHPPLNHFLGIPFFKKGGEMNGMVGIANKPGGYTQADIEFLEPFTVTCSNLIEAYWQVEQKHKCLINTLEEKVKERTHELELTNERLIEANCRVLRASAAQLEHFACMSHEIRTPLNCIIGLSSLLLETNLTPMQEESMRMIVTSGDLLLTVVNDVLDYSKLETGNVDIEIQRSNLQETLNSVVHSIETKAQSKRLSVRTWYDAALTEFIRTDSRRLQQILYNLLGNAIKFSKDGGVIELSVLLCPASPNKNYMVSFGQVCSEGTAVVKDSEASGLKSGCPFYQSSAKDASRSSGGASQCPFRPSTPQAVGPAEGTGDEEQVLRFVVKDYGKGIERKDLDRIFQPFLQASAETERVYGGTGLGLAITAKLVAGLGGTISVDSEEGEWSKFTVDLPFREAPADIDGISYKLKDATIYLIDNDENNVRDVSHIFSRYKVNFVNFRGMGEMIMTIEKQDALFHECSYICLVHEDLYEEESYQFLSKLKKSVFLVTFGPKDSVPDTDWHFRSLVQVLPSVLMESISACVRAKKAPSQGLVRLPSQSSANVVPYRELRVLIAEDNVINQKVLIRMLRRLGMENVDIVDNGKEAVDREASTKYDVVLMDIQMPVMDGLEACRLIMNRSGGPPKPKVVFVTAHVLHSFEVECMKTGSSGFLPKPFNIGEIDKCFRRLYMLGDSPAEDAGSPT